jgi:SAM-dependent methyltransferase
VSGPWTPDALEAARKEIVRRHGPWTAYNLDLGHGITTFGRADHGAPEQNIARIAQLVVDNVRKPLTQSRILDLGAYEGGFAVELAAAGAEVVVVEGRDHHVAKIEFVRDVRELDRLDVRLADVRDLAQLDLGRFDVVLCLGILYHLQARDCFRLVEQIRGCCDELAVIETQISTKPAREIWHGGNQYWGRESVEDQSLPGAAIGNSTSFWMTKPSLLNLLSDAGFTSVTEAHVPAVPAIGRFCDHLTLLARPGSPWTPRALPPEEPLGRRHPERPETVTHPEQSPRWLSPRRRAAQRAAIAGIFRAPGT